MSTALQAAYQTAVVGGLPFTMARSITREIAEVLHGAPLPEHEADTQRPTAAVNV